MRVITIVGADTDAIRAGVAAALNVTPTAHPQIYGDGKASEKIVSLLQSQDKLAL